LLALPCDGGLVERLKFCLVCKQLKLPELQIVAGAIPLGCLCQRCSDALRSVRGSERQSAASVRAFT